MQDNLIRIFSRVCTLLYKAQFFARGQNAMWTTEIGYCASAYRRRLNWSDKAQGRAQRSLNWILHSTQLFSSRTLSAYFSRSISPRVRIPSRRKRGKGGHHPCKPCCKRNGKTMAGRNNHFLFLVKPRIRPDRAKLEALTSSTRSISHSLSSIWIRSRISALHLSL